MSGAHVRGAEPGRTTRRRCPRCACWRGTCALTRRGPSTLPLRHALPADTHAPPPVKLRSLVQIERVPVQKTRCTGGSVCVAQVLVLQEHAPFSLLGQSLWIKQPGTAKHSIGCGALRLLTSPYFTLFCHTGSPLTCISSNIV